MTQEMLKNGVKMQAKDSQNEFPNDQQAGLDRSLCWPSLERIQLPSGEFADLEKQTRELLAVSKSLRQISDEICRYAVQVRAEANKNRFRPGVLSN